MAKQHIGVFKSFLKLPIDLAKFDIFIEHTTKTDVIYYDICVKKHKYSFWPINFRFGQYNLIQDDNTVDLWSKQQNNSEFALFMFYFNQPLMVFDETFGELPIHISCKNIMNWPICTYYTSGQINPLIYFNSRGAVTSVPIFTDYVCVYGYRSSALKRLMEANPKYIIGIKSGRKDIFEIWPSLQFRIDNDQIVMANGQISNLTVLELVSQFRTF